MAEIGLEALQSEIEVLKTVRRIGRIADIRHGVVNISGLSDVAALGDLVEIYGAANSCILAEVTHLDLDVVTAFPDGALSGLRVGDRVALLGEDRIAPHESWIGRIVDPFGKALSGPPLLAGPVPRPLQGLSINPADRRGLGGRLETGLSVFNTMLPIVRGQRIGLFSGSGVGKSTLLGKLAIGLQTDVVVVAMIGERGREVREFVERILGPIGMKRAVVVAATSDQSALVRRRCAWAAMSIAEHFRDQGRQVLFLADSLTRFAEAHREIALATGEGNSLRGYPPSVAHLIMQLCERAGPGVGAGADITAIFSVLVAGSDMEEPVADITRGVLDGHVVLDRKIAERGRFPAIDILRSVSRALPHAATDAENAMISRARALLGTYENNEMMIRAGLYTSGTDPEIDDAIDAWPKLDQFIASSAHRGIGASFSDLQSCLLPRTGEADNSEAGSFEHSGDMESRPAGSLSPE